MTAPGYKNHKSCKILPKFLPTLHFLKDSHKFAQEPQILQIYYYNVEHFLQVSDNIFAKIAFFCDKFYQKMRCVISTYASPFCQYWVMQLYHFSRSGSFFAGG